VKAHRAYELETPNCDLLSLFSGLRPRQLHLESVLAGHSSGRVFVDRVERPRLKFPCLKSRQRRPRRTGIASCVRIRTHVW